MNYAVIDIGTNTLILLIAKIVRKSIVPLVDRAIITRLGQGLAENHCFSSEAMQRTQRVLDEFIAQCREKKVKKIITVGTAAWRIAANAQVFLDRLKDELKLKVEVISGQQEAEYVFLSAWHDFGEKNRPLIVFDVGGGSTEIITGPIGGKKFGPSSTASLSLGSVRFTEQYIHHDPIQKEEFSQLHRAIKNTVIDELGDFYPPDFDPAASQVIATAGTVTTLYSLANRMGSYDPESVHGGTLALSQVTQMINTLIPLSIAERQRLPGMEPLRADVLLCGALICKEILEFFGKQEMIVSDHGLRYGVFYKKYLK